jgi:hypothetical protein
MRTRKSTSSKAAAIPAVSTPSTSRKGKKARAKSGLASEVLGAARQGYRSFEPSKLIAPGAAVLASGAMAALGYVFKEQLGDVIVEALKATTKGGGKAVAVTSKAFDATRDEAMDAVERLSEKVSLESLLRYAGLQRKSTITSILGPAIGVACGIVAGSALTYFFGPKLLEQLNDKGISSAAATMDHQSEPEPAPSVTSPLRANGDLRGGIS